MLVKILLRRHQAVERMAEEAVTEADLAAVLLLQLAGGRIDPIPRTSRRQNSRS